MRWGGATVSVNEAVCEVRRDCSVLQGWLDRPGRPGRATSPQLDSNPTGRQSCGRSPVWPHAITRPCPTDTELTAELLCQSGSGVARPFWSLVRPLSNDLKNSLTLIWFLSFKSFYVHLLLQSCLSSLLFHLDCNSHSRKG